MEEGIDLWPLVEGLTPLLEEMERIERLAAGKAEADDRDADGQGQEGRDDEGPEGRGDDHA